MSNKLAKLDEVLINLKNYFNFTPNFDRMSFLNKKRKRIALGAISKNTKKSFFSSRVLSRLVEKHPSNKLPKLDKVWVNLNYSISPQTLEAYHFLAPL